MPYQTFTVHRTDLQQRRARCAPVVAQVKALGTTYVPACPVCENPHRAVIATQDRYGTDTRLALCLGCGLIYQLDPLTKSAFDTFYAEHYRKMEQLYTGQPLTTTYIPASVRPSALRYADELLAVLRGQLTLGPGASVLDAGGSIGVIANRVAQAYGCRAVVIDPAAPEVAVAQADGIEAHVATLETWQTDEQFDFIMILRSVEHLFDLRTAFDRARALLRPGGALYVDYQDITLQTRYVGPAHSCAKLDHKFWLTTETAPVVLQHLGWEIVYQHYNPSYSGRGLLLRPAPPNTTPPPGYGQTLNNLLREVAHNHITWDQISERPNSLQWLRAEARRLRAYLRG